MCVPGVLSRHLVGLLSVDAKVGGHVDDLRQDALRFHNASKPPNYSTYQPQALNTRNYCHAEHALILANFSRPPCPTVVMWGANFPGLRLAAWRTKQETIASIVR